MEANQDYLRDIREIRNLMERSVRFISLSGLSGILAGIYALAGVALAFRILYPEGSFPKVRVTEPGPVIFRLTGIALAVLILTLASGLWLSYRKSRKQKIVFWGPGSRQFLWSLVIPLVTGGLFIAALTYQGFYAMVVPGFLVFYGISLNYAARHAVSDIQWLGYFEILIGLFSALFPLYGIVSWALGFGVMHLIYGVIMLIKYGM